MPKRRKLSPEQNEEGDLSPEQIHVDDIIISQYMPILYRAVVNNDIAGVKVCLQAYDKQIRDAYTDDETIEEDVHNIFTTTIGSVLNTEVRDAHQNLYPIQVADLLGYHDICQIFINNYYDEPQYCSEISHNPVGLTGE
jgi:hypothetical protein